MKRTAIIAIVQSVLLSSVLVGFSAGAEMPFDAVNLGNLNVRFKITTFQRAGRGSPYSYDIAYDNNVWSPAYVSGTNQWQPATGYGWNFAVPTYAFGQVQSTIITSWTQPCDPQHNNWTPVYIEVYGNFTYRDVNGAPHPFDFLTSNYTLGNTCPAVSAPPYTWTAIAQDGSGYTINAVASSGSITGRDGKIINTSGGGWFTTTDSNGNQVTGAPNQQAQFLITDTLGSTALTISGTNPVLMTYTPPNGVAVSYSVNYSSYNIKTNFGCSGVAETTTNGVSLVSSITLPDNTQYSFTYEDTVGFSGYKTGRLASVTLPTGGSIAYSYPPGNNGTTNGINCNGGGAPLASGGNPSMTRTLSPGGTWSYSLTNVSGNHWQTKVTSPPDPTVGNDTVIDFQGNITQYATSLLYETQRQVYQGSASPSNLLLTTITCYNGNYANCTTTAVSSPITQTDTYTQLPNGSTRLSEVTSNAYGVDTDVREYNYGVAMGAAPSSTYLVRETAINYGSYNGSGCTALTGIANKPCQITVKDWRSGTAQTLSSATYSYDQTTPSTLSGTPHHTSVTGSRGNLTTVATQVNGSTKLYKVFTYYDTGNVRTATDLGTTSSGGPNVTTYNYPDATSTCGNAFPKSVSEPLSLSQSFTWDCTGGALTSVTDENNQTSSVYYTGSNFGMSADPNFWRPYATTDQLGNATTLSYPSNTVMESALLFNSGQSVVDQRAKLDALGRIILSQMKGGPTSANYDSTQMDYDVFGRSSKSYMPFTNTADATCSGTCPGVTTTYDALSRPRAITDGGGGTVTYTYTNNDVYQDVGPHPSGENDKIRQLEYDGLGRLSSVCEVTSASGSGSCAQTNAQTGFWTKYTYDVLGDMTGVTQNAQAASGSKQTRTYTFDMLGRMLTEINPETGTSSITYVYDSWDTSCGSYTSVGDLVEKKDAMGNVTCIKFDALHRVTQTTYPSGTYASVTPTKCYVYDSATVNGQSMAMAKTRLAEAYTTSASSCPGTVTVDEGFSYSVRGEMQDVWEKTPDSDGYYHVNATYWANGRLNVLNGGTNPLPGLPAITYGAMDGKGRITQVAAASGQNPVNSISWNAGNQVTGVTFGSLDTDAYQYDPNTGRMQQYQFNMGTGPQSQTGALTWNANSTLRQMQITDQINTANSQTCTYSHDDLTRITSANCGSVWAQTFSLDPFGNLSKSGSAVFQPTYTGASGTGTTPSNQYYQISGGGAGTSNYYDSNGNLKNDVTHSYSWDADGNMLSTDGSTVTMIYDALDRMAEQTRGSSHTEIVYGPYGLKLALMNGQTLVNAFVKLPGGSRAVYGASGLAYYRHSDHLGSSRLATTPTRTKYYDVAYAPYGEDYNGSGTTPDLAFTDENQDTVGGGWSTNIYDFMFREYRTAHGRWTSPDPAGLGAVDPTNPQTWNRYAYVTNNPLSFVDPSGLVSACPPYNPGDILLDPGNGSTVCPIYGPPPGCWYMGLYEGGWGGTACGAPTPLLPCTNYVMANCGDANSGAANNGTQKPSCTALQAAASKLGQGLENVSSKSGWIAFGTGSLTVLAGLGEAPTAGFDTPGTIAAGMVTEFFATVSVLSSGTAAILNSYAAGNTSAMSNFSVSQLTNIAAKAAASKLPLVKPWADRIGDLAEQAADLALKAEGGCQ